MCVHAEAFRRELEDSPKCWHVFLNLEALRTYTYTCSKCIIRVSRRSCSPNILVRAEPTCASETLEYHWVLCPNTRSRMLSCGENLSSGECRLDNGRWPCSCWWWWVRPNRWMKKHQELNRWTDVPTWAEPFGPGLGSTKELIKKSFHIFHWLEQLRLRLKPTSSPSIAPSAPAPKAQQRWMPFAQSRLCISQTFKERQSRWCFPEWIGFETLPRPNRNDLSFDIRGTSWNTHRLQSFSSFGFVAKRIGAAFLFSFTTESEHVNRNRSTIVKQPRPRTTKEQLPYYTVYYSIYFHIIYTIRSILPNGQLHTEHIVYGHEDNFLRLFADTTTQINWWRIQSPLHLLQESHGCKQPVWEKQKDILRRCR